MVAHQGVPDSEEETDQQSECEVLLHLERFVQELGTAGWYSRLGRFENYPFPHHSVTLINDNWPCDIDVHHRFPGFLADPALTFDVLWSHRAQMPMAGQQINIPDFPSSVLIMALHSARSTPENPRHPAELGRLIALSRCWAPQQRAAIAELAALTGCAGALSAVLPLLGVQVLADLPDIDPDERAAWRLKIEGRDSPKATWLRYLRAGGVRALPKRLWEAVWPAEDFLRATRYIPDGGTAVNRERLRRLVSGVPKLPRAGLELFGLHGRNVTDATRQDHSSTART